MIVHRKSIESSLELHWDVIGNCFIETKDNKQPMNWKKPLPLKEKTIIITAMSIIAITAILTTLILTAESQYTTSPPPTWHYDQDLTDQWINENNPSYDVEIYRESFCGKCYPIGLNLYKINSDGMELLMTGFLLENGSVELNDR